jgi:hypothetical protein
MSAVSMASGRTVGIQLPSKINSLWQGYASFFASPDRIRAASEDWRVGVPERTQRLNDVSEIQEKLRGQGHLPIGRSRD